MQGFCKLLFNIRNADKTGCIIYLKGGQISFALKKTLGEFNLLDFMKLHLLPSGRNRSSLAPDLMLID